MTDLVHDNARATLGEPIGAAERTLGAVLEELRVAAVRVMASTVRPPQRLRVEAGGAAVELAWPELIESGPVGSTQRTALNPTEELLALLGTQQLPAAGLANPAPQHGGNEAVAAPRMAVDPEAHCVCAPTVGVFYRAPEPGTPPFVEVGDLVTVGQQLAIVEAMKLMIPVEADRSGRIREILATDATAVEYGERLIAIVPEHAP